MCQPCKNTSEFQRYVGININNQVFSLQHVKEENTLLSSQLKETKERTSGEGEEAPGANVNGEVAAQMKVDQSSINLNEHMEM